MEECLQTTTFKKKAHYIWSLDWEVTQ